MTTEKLKINQQNEITLAAYKYNKLSEQVAKYLYGSSGGSDFNQQVDYTYNEKGWLRQMDTVSNLGLDLFALDLRYNTPRQQRCPYSRCTLQRQHFRVALGCRNAKRFRL